MKKKQKDDILGGEGQSDLPVNEGEQDEEAGCRNADCVADFSILQSLEDVLTRHANPRKHTSTSCKPEVLMSPPRPFSR
jgi:hypothetical protein